MESIFPDKRKRERRKKRKGKKIILRKKKKNFNIRRDEYLYIFMK